MQQCWIEDLLAVLDTGSVMPATEQRFLTQSALTRRMLSVESALGTQLLDRTRKPVQLLPHILNKKMTCRQGSTFDKVPHLPDTSVHRQLLNYQ